MTDFTIVTNAYNQGAFLASAAHSVLTQTGGSVEYIIVDPGSTDDTGAILERMAQIFPGQFTVIRERDSGPADGLNRAFQNARGQWLFYLNADDVLLPGALCAAKRAIAHAPECGALLGNGYIVDPTGRYIRRAVSNRFTPRRFVRGLSFALQQASFYRADIFHKIGGFNAMNSTSWDAELLIDIARAGHTIGNFDAFIALFRMHAGSITMSQRLAQDSLRTHERYFTEEMGRAPQWHDRTLKRVLQLVQNAAHPRRTVHRIRDQIWPRPHIFAEAAPPSWANDQG